MYVITDNNHVVVKHSNVMTPESEIEKDGFHQYVVAKEDAPGVGFEYNPNAKK